MVPIIEYVCSYGGGFYVNSNLDFKGQGIKKTGDGSDHKRGLLTFHFTEKALKKMKGIHKEAKYIYKEY